ncbi:response regulator [Microvirga aerilata]|jgi:two-component system, response regulator PdtaR|uniref:Response regulator n=1 Tax=Microvirga aerilata TaxID=670292 RepID=A0A936ZJ48_9HYPH|nr:response regulator [Microvirga aerilata]MBL0405639.1 response regulator [Microvirga aerilata]
MNTTGSKPPVILVVEDETLLRMLAGDILTEDAGYRVIEAVNADEALIMLESRHDVRLVFTDVNMPGALNGFALARIVDMRFPGIKVIVTSGLARPGVGDLPKGKRFLPKPYAPSALITLVQEMIGKAAGPVVVPLDPVTVEHGSPVLPTAIKVGQMHSGIGAAGGLAQPLPEPEE